MGAIHDAVEEGDLAAVRQLLSKNPACLHETFADTPDQPLHLAAWQNRAQIVRFLIEAGAEINARGWIGWSPLHYTAVYGGFEAAVLLCDAGADINQKDDKGFPPLLNAARGREQECVEIAQLLLKRGCEADLNSLISLGEVERVKEFLRRDPDAVQNAVVPNELIDDAVIFVQCEGGDSSIPQQTTSADRQQVIEKYRDFFDALIAAGADVNAVGLHGQTALSNVQFYPDAFPELVPFLIELGAR